MPDGGLAAARERLRRAVGGYAGGRRTTSPARPAQPAGVPRTAAGAPATGDGAARGRAAAQRDERGLRALAKEIKALISEDGRRGIRVG